VQQQLGRILPPDDFATWVAPTTLQAIEGHDIVIATPNVFVRQELEARFLDPLTATLEAVLGHAVAVHLIIGQL
jgi:chromosomal replication initiation ATPase DnaA